MSIRRSLYYAVIATVILFGLFWAERAISQPDALTEAKNEAMEDTVAAFPIIVEGTVEIPITPEAEILRKYLESKKSPLAGATETLLETEHWKLSIGISFAESTFCRFKPASNYNCWGVGGSSNMWNFGSDIRQAVIKFESFLNSNPRGKKYADMTLSEMNGIYCQNENYAGRKCPNWEQNVQGIINELTNLGL